MKSVTFRKLAAGLGLVALAAFTTACLVTPAEHRVVVHEPAPVVESDIIYVEPQRHGVVREYYYYPETQVYYDPISVSFFWHDRGTWRSGRHLPPHIRVYEHNRVRIRTDAPRPYAVHPRIITKYPHGYGRMEGRPGRGDVRRDDRRGYDERNRRDDYRGEGHDNNRGDRRDNGRGEGRGNGRGEGRGGH